MALQWGLDDGDFGIDLHWDLDCGRKKALDLGDDSI
jgi:hypothetical protein